MSARSLALCALLAAGACAGGQSTAEAVAPARTADGASILGRTCTVCHNLRGLSAYQDYWGEREWQSMVETMIEYGAVIAPEEIPVLVRYLAVNYGTAGDRP